MSRRVAFQADALRTLLSERMADNSDVHGTVHTIIQQIRQEGDTALLAYTARFDRWDASENALRVTSEEIAEAVALTSPEVIKSLKVAAARIRAYSEKQLPKNADYIDDTGVRLGWRWTALDAVGLYVPGGTAAYPSSVLMNAVPALAAGVARLVMVVPAPEGNLTPAILAAAHVAGISEIYKIGGAQAIAALAYGTETIPAVDKIVGPGNAYVAEAKRQVFGQVGIDMIAGPSEICVVADANANPAWIAADLLSQAEHDALAQSILITDDAAFADKVEQEIIALLAQLPRKDMAEASWRDYGAIVIVANMQAAAEAVNIIAPEHLELAVMDPDRILPHIRHAGAIFLGYHTPEAIGDYIAGPSHVLPTHGTARFASGLSVFDFLKRTSTIGCSAEGFGALAHYTGTLADAEGLGAHAASVRVRMNRED